MVRIVSVKGIEAPDGCVMLEFTTLGKLKEELPSYVQEIYSVRNEAYFALCDSNIGLIVYCYYNEKEKEKSSKED